MDVNPKSSVLYPFNEHMPCSVSYLPMDTTQGILEAIGVSSSVMFIDGEMREQGVDLYNPQRFRYTRPDGTVYVISAQNGIESVTDNYGRAITYDDSGIHHSSGASLTFERGAGNRIEKITDPLGRTVEYHYDDDGNLVSVVRSGHDLNARQSGRPPYDRHPLPHKASAQALLSGNVFRHRGSGDGNGSLTAD